MVRDDSLYIVDPVDVKGYDEVESILKTDDLKVSSKDIQWMEVNIMIKIN